MTRPTPSPTPPSSPRPSPEEALRSLRRREVPAGVLDGFYDALRERMPDAPAGGGMSLAFLGTPRALRVWRSTAVAATVLLGLGVGWVATGGLDRAAPEPTPLGDPRDVLLLPYDARSARPGDVGGLRAATVAYPHRRTFRVMPPPPKPAEPAAPVPRWE